MNTDKILQVISIYRKKFEEMKIAKADFPHEEYLDSPLSGFEHCHAMLEKMEKFLTEGRVDKVYRWLGFLQGYLWSQGIYTLDELTNHNKKD